MEQELDAVTRFVELERQKRELKAKMDELNRQIAKTKEDVLNVFERTGLQSVSVEDMTVYVAHLVGAKLRVTKDEALPVVREWAPDLVQTSFNMNRISALIREIHRQEGGRSLEELKRALPAKVLDCFDVQDWFDVRAVKRS